MSDHLKRDDGEHPAGPSHGFARTAYARHVRTLQTLAWEFAFLFNLKFILRFQISTHKWKIERRNVRNVWLWYRIEFLVDGEEGEYWNVCSSAKTQLKCFISCENFHVPAGILCLIHLSQWTHTKGHYSSLVPSSTPPWNTVRSPLIRFK